MTLEKKVAALVVVRRRPARVLFKNKVSILVSLSFSGLDQLRRKIIEIAEFRDHARRILERVRALGDLDEGVFFHDRCVGMTGALVREDGVIIIIFISIIFIPFISNIFIIIIIINSLTGITSSCRDYALHNTRGCA